MKILVYDDSLEFGGHQTMACQGIEALAADAALEVVFMFDPRNKRLINRIAGIPNLQTMEAHSVTLRFQGLRNHFNPRSIRALEKEFHALNPELIICIQGDIEQSSQAVLAACRAGIECISYIAIPHRMADMGAKLGALRDRTNRHLLNQPDRYITISESMKRILIERGVKKPITVVPNGIPMPHAPCPMRQEQQVVLGMIGRIEFNQKRQDFMVRSFCNHPESFQDCRLLIAGSGPDEAPLKQLVAECPRSSDITILPWQDGIDSLYAQIDFLMLPSRYEGVPLVMLEALARGIPVIGSARDGMKEILPADWIFETGNAGALAETFSIVRKSWQGKIDVLREKILIEHSLGNFKNSFRNAVCFSL